MKFIPNPLAEAAIKRSPVMVEHLGGIAGTIVEAAKGIAPVLSGAYRDGLQAQAGIEGDGAKGRANATDFKSWWIEVGTSDTPTFAVLRRACDAAGVELSAKGP